MSALREATLAVVQAALAAGHLSPERLRVVLLIQARLGSCNDPAQLLPLLRWKFLPPESLSELTRVYKRHVANSSGPAPRPPVLRPEERKQAQALLDRSEDLLSSHADLDPPDVQEFLRDAGADIYEGVSESSTSEGLDLHSESSLSDGVLEASDEGELDLFPDSSLSSAVLDDSDLGPLDAPLSANSSSAALFEESGEGQLDLIPSSAASPADFSSADDDASEFASAVDDSSEYGLAEPSSAEDDSSEYGLAGDSSADDDSDTLQVDSWSPDSSAQEPIEEEDEASDPQPREQDPGWGESARLSKAKDAPEERKPKTSRRARPEKGSRKSGSTRTKRNKTSAAVGGIPAKDHRYEFRGSVMWLLLLQLLGSASFLGMLLAVLAGLPNSGWRPAQRASATLFRNAPALQRLAAEVNAILSAPPPIALLIGAVVLLLATCVVSNAVRLYRITHTHVFDMRLACREGWGFREEVFSLVVTTLTLGLGVPWVISRRRRWFYRSCHVRGTNMELGFSGTGFQALGLSLLTLLALPLIVATLGLLAIRVHFWWLAWERRHMLIPDPDGRLHGTRFSGKGRDYFKLMAPRYLATLLTLGVYRPWALVASWRWLDRHTDVE